MIREDGFKQCRGCGEWKPVAEFYSCKTPRSDGYTSHCKPCDKARAIAYQKAHPEKKAAQDRKRQQQPHVKAQRSHRAKERKAEQLASDPVALRAREQKAQERYRETHRIALRESRKVRRAANLELFRLRAAYSIDQQHRGDDATKIELNPWLRVREAFDNCCCYCGSSENLSIDHLTPFAKGGKNEIGNVALACLPCNKTKCKRTVEEFVPEKAIAIRRKAMLL